MRRTDATRLGILLLLLGFLVACPEEGDDADQDTGTTDAGSDTADEDTGSDDAGDLDADDDTDSSTDTSEDAEPAGPGTVTVVVDEIAFPREEPRGHSDGFDLDNTVSSAATPVGCGQLDFVNDEGLEGIDNQLAKLLPIIEVSGGQQFEDYVAGAIRDGDLLLLFEMTGVDSLQNDDDVQGALMRANGTPYTDDQGVLEPFQTFDVAVNEPWAYFPDGSIEDGVMHVGPFDFTLPFYIFDFVFWVDVIDAQLELRIDEEGNVTGKLGGAITIENLIQIGSMIEGDEETFIALFDGPTRLLADLLPDDDGNCQAISIAMTFGTTPVFIYDDSPRIDFSAEQ